MQFDWSVTCNRGRGENGAEEVDKMAGPWRVLFAFKDVGLVSDALASHVNRVVR